MVVKNTLKWLVRIPKACFIKQHTFSCWRYAVRWNAVRICLHLPQCNMEPFGLKQEAVQVGGCWKYDSPAPPAVSSYRIFCHLKWSHWTRQLQEFMAAVHQRYEHDSHRIVRWSSSLPDCWYPILKRYERLSKLSPIIIKKHIIIQDLQTRL